MTAVLNPTDAFRHNMFPSHDDNHHDTFSSSSNVDWRAKYLEVADVLAETRNELDEFQTSSKELEEELERELERVEKAQNDLKAKVSRAEGERDEWKSKFMTLQTTHNTTTTSLQRELDMLRQESQRTKIQLRDLEMGNDDLERNERAIASSLADVEAKYARALEEKILLEHELLDKASLEEEHQRMKDELRDANEEIAILRKQAAPSRASMVTDISSTSSNFPSTSLADRISSDYHPPQTPVADLQLSDLITSAESSPAPLAVSSKPNSPVRPTLGKSVVRRSGLGLSRTVSATATNALSRSTTQPPSLGRTVARGSPHPRTGLSIRTSSAISPPPGAPVLPTPGTPSGAPKNKTVQKVSDWRNRFSTLEQKIHTRVPRLRLSSTGGQKLLGPSTAPPIDRPPLSPIVTSSPYITSTMTRTSSMSARPGSIDISPRKRPGVSGEGDKRRSATGGDQSWVFIMEDSPSPSPIRDRERLRAAQLQQQRAGSPTEQVRAGGPIRATGSLAGGSNRLFTRSMMGISNSPAFGATTTRRPPSNVSATTTERSISVSTNGTSVSTPLSSRPTTPTTLPVAMGSSLAHGGPTNGSAAHSISGKIALGRSHGPSAFTSVPKRSSLSTSTALGGGPPSGIRPPSGGLHRSTSDTLTTDDLAPLPSMTPTTSSGRGPPGGTPRPPSNDMSRSRIGRASTNRRPHAGSNADNLSASTTGLGRYRSGSAATLK